MHKHKYYKPPKPSTLQQKPIDLESRPQFTTDFSDQEKYKLSELEMIQKKAALQSKNRQTARQQLEQRRRKLQMGIIDEDTRKIYQTALTSKSIDLNPSIRRNLSQMIQYQRERSARKNSKGSQNKERKRKNVEDNSEEQNQSQGFDGQIKKNQHFIKKLQKAKKQQNIGKAVQILMNDKKSSNFGPTKPLSNNSKTNNSKDNQNQSRNQQDRGNDNFNSSRVSSMSQQQALSNIEQTIKFMQQKLFNPNWKKNKTGTQNTSSQSSLQNKNTLKSTSIGFNKQNKNNHNEDIKCSTISQISYDCQHNEFLSNLPSARQTSLNPTFPSPISSNFNEQDSESFDMQGNIAALRLNFKQKTKIQVQNKNQPLFSFKNSNNNNTNPFLKSKNNQQQYKAQQLQQQQDDCLSTIRKMKQMMQSKAYLYDNKQCGNYKENKNNYNSQRSHGSYKSQVDAQIDFSLTLNEDQIQQHNRDKRDNRDNRDHRDHSSIYQNFNKDKNKNKKFNDWEDQQQKPIKKQAINNYTIQQPKLNRQQKKQTDYQQLKRSLFQQIDQFQQTNNFNKNSFDKTSKYLDQDQQQIQIPAPIQYQFTNIKTNQNNIESLDKPSFRKHEIKQTIPSTTILANNSVPVATYSPSPSLNKQPQQPALNKQLQQLKNLVHGTKNNVKSINVQKIGIDNNNNINQIKPVMGFDYRGSINIKKHIVQQ